MQKVLVNINMDFKLLREQKQALLRHIDFADAGSDDREHLEGILCLIDHIQDRAVDSGQYSEEAVFGTMDEE